MSAPTLDRAIGPVAATLLVIGGIIGSGIFLTTGIMAAALPSPTLLLVAWAAGGLFALFGALSYAELAAMYPRAGGVYVYLKEAFGSLPGVPLWVGDAADRALRRGRCRRGRIRRLPELLHPGVVTRSRADHGEGW